MNPKCHICGEEMEEDAEESDVKMYGMRTYWCYKCGIFEDVLEQQGRS